MRTTMAARIAALQDMTLADLRESYHEVFGEETRSRHKDFLRKRIAWRLQANALGGLSARARRRAEELANDADLRVLAPKARTVTGPLAVKRDSRLPMPGTVLTREYRGQTVTVTVLDAGFEYAGQVYRSLSAVAKAVTGSHWNGLLFFQLTGTGGER